MALNIVHIPFPVDCPVDISGAVALCPVVRPQRGVQVAPLVPGSLHFASDVVVCDIEISAYICEQAWE